MITSWIRSAVALLFLTTAAYSEVKFEKVDSGLRDQYLKRAEVWHPVKISERNVLAGPQTEIAVPPNAEVKCKYVEPKEGSSPGKSPKFLCKSASGELFRVKYGKETREIYGEVAGTRLLWVLGFYADDVYPARVMCSGCPEKNPAAPEKEERRGDRMFEYAIIERNFPGEIIEASEDQGWKWTELEKLEKDSEGAPLAHFHALKLLAAFMQHSDSKPDNQRLACYNDDLEDPDKDGVFSCKRPVLMIDDPGSTFGAGVGALHLSKFDFEGWADQEIWNIPKEARTRDQSEPVCIAKLTSNKAAQGEGLDDPVISEQGRRFLAELLNQLSVDQIRDLFRVAGVEKLRQEIKDGDKVRAVTVDDWVAAFVKKRTEINEHKCALFSNEQ